MAKRQAAKAGIGVTGPANGFASCDDPAAPQEIGDRLNVDDYTDRARLGKAAWKLDPNIAKLAQVYTLIRSCWRRLR